MSQDFIVDCDVVDVAIIEQDEEVERGTMLGGLGLKLMRLA